MQRHRLVGEDLHGVVAVLRVSGPSFTLRKKALMIFTLDDYVKSGTMTKAQAEIIRKGVSARRNILVVGGTGSGKTTLINAIIREMSDQNPLERVVIIEDTGELQCAAADYVQFRSNSRVTMIGVDRLIHKAVPDDLIQVYFHEAFLPLLDEAIISRLFH